MWGVCDGAIYNKRHDEPPLREILIKTATFVVNLNWSLFDYHDDSDFYLVIVFFIYFVI